MPTQTDMPIPAYQHGDAKAFFALMDLTFATYQVTDAAKQFLYAMQALTPELRTLAASITNAEEDNKYSALKKLVIETTETPEKDRIQQLLSQATMGSRRPSEYLQHLNKLAGDEGEQAGRSSIVRAIWFKNLPADMQPIVAGSKGDTITELAETADKIWDYRRPHEPQMNALHTTATHTSAHHTVEINNIRDKFREENHKLQLASTKAQAQMEAMQTSMSLMNEALQSLRIEVQRLSYNSIHNNNTFQQSAFNRGRSLSRDTSRPYAQRDRTPPTQHGSYARASSRSRQPSPHTPRGDDTACWYHTTFGAAARSCQTPCSWNPSRTQGPLNDQAA